MIHRMNQLKRLLLAAGVSVLGFSSSIAQGATIVIDDFNNYSNSTLLQNLPGTNWSRFGNATADGIYSIAGGVGGTRGANYLVNYNTTTAVNGSVRYTYATPQSFEGNITFSLDIAVNTVRPGTKVFAQIASSDATPTIFETLVGQSLSSTSYQTFTFSFSAENIKSIQGSKTLDQVVADLKSITFRFNNTLDTGSQTISFDNLIVTTAIPEPSLAWLSLIGGGLAIGASIRKRRTGVQDAHPSTV